MIKYQIKGRKLLIHLLRSNNLLSMQIIKIRNNWKLNKRKNKKLRNKGKKIKRNKNIRIFHVWENRSIKLKR